MINQLVNYGANRLMGLGLVAVGLGGFYAYDRYDKSAHYLPAKARVSSVEESCYMEKRSGRSTWTSDVLACDLAKFAVQNHPKWEGYTVKYKITLKYDYVSPVDRRTHSGQRQMSAYPNGKKPSPGEVIDIRVSRTDPNKTREI